MKKDVQQASDEDGPVDIHVSISRAMMIFSRPAAGYVQLPAILMLSTLSQKAACFDLLFAAALYLCAQGSGCLTEGRSAS